MGFQTTGGAHFRIFAEATACVCDTKVFTKEHQFRLCWPGIALRQDWVSDGLLIAVEGCSCGPSHVTNMECNLQCCSWPSLLCYSKSRYSESVMRPNFLDSERSDSAQCEGIKRSSAPARSFSGAGRVTITCFNIFTRTSGYPWP